jgi:hypothetical protein
MTVFRAASLAALGMLCALAASEVGAQLPSKLKQSEEVWKGMDNCKRQAWKQYPDYTPEGHAKREHAEKLCLNTGNLPPVAPPGVRSGSSRPPLDAR